MAEIVRGSSAVWAKHARKSPEWIFMTSVAAASLTLVHVAVMRGDGGSRPERAASFVTAADAHELTRARSRDRLSPSPRQNASAVLKGVEEESTLGQGDALDVAKIIFEGFFKLQACCLRVLRRSILCQSHQLVPVG